MFLAIEVSVPSYKHNELNEDRSNASLFYKVVDIPTSESFCRNYGGHIRSDVAILNEQSDMSVINALVSRLQQLPNSGDLNASVSDLFASLKSKYQQTSSELIAHFDSLLEKRDNEIAAKQADEAAKREREEIAAKRKALQDSLTNEERDYLRKLRRDKEVQSLIDF